MTVSPSTRLPSRRQRIGAVPVVSPGWALALSGEVAHPLLMTPADLMAFPTHDCVAPLVCTMRRATISEAAQFTGVGLASLLASAHPLPTAAYATITAVDGYTSVLPLSLLTDAILAFERNAQPLSAEDGAPLRLIVPGYAGYKQVKWVTRIDFSSVSGEGFWEARGYPLDGTLPPLSTILAPTPHQPVAVGHATTISGLAAPATGARAPLTVSVRVNGSDWQDADIAADNRYRFRWQIDWIPPYVGDYVLQVEARCGADVGSPTSVIVSAVAG